ncbi:MAG: DoxX family protein [Pseudomonadota bacterium]
MNIFDDRTTPAGTDAGLLVLRIGLAIVFLAHSVYLKLMVFTLAGTAGFFESLGLPASLAYLVFGAEAIGGVLLITGLFVRPTALVLAVISLGALWAHAGAGWLFSAEGGGWEYPAFLMITSAVLILTGPGRLTVKALFRSNAAATTAVPA